jgi:hydrogenase large subunit
MPDIFLPSVSRGSVVPPVKLVIDPITRIEGHLRVEVELQDGAVTDAWSSGTMFRGIEMVLQGRDPRDAWVFAQRLCGVCTTVHAISSVRAVENALGITVPDNARLIRNLLEGAQYIQDHVIHFYHLHAPDWVDIVSALSADPAATSVLAKSISDWPTSEPANFQSARDRVQTFVNSGQLGIFGNGYWGHPEYRLPPEGNLLALTHYLEALGWQREVIKLHAILGGKNPHPQTYLVGGMSIPVDPASSAAINAQTISQLRALVAKARDFVSRVYIPDLLLLASFYKGWAGLGSGVSNFLSYGDFPQDTSGAPSALWLPSGVVLNGNLQSAPQAFDQTQVSEYVTHSWYTYAGGDGAGLHPSQGQTQPNYTGPQPPFDYLNVEGKYSWLKTPRYNHLPMEVGPLARMVVAYAAGHTRVRQLIDQALASLQLSPSALFSTLGRTLARGLETLLVAEKMAAWVSELEANMNSGKLAIHNNTRWDPATWPSEAVGWGSTEAPRGALGHWVRISNGKIANYQMVVATAWNGSPRDGMGQRGVWEQALIGTPVCNPAQPLELLRTVHSFDPCMSCAVHIVDTRSGDSTRVELS